MSFATHSENAEYIEALYEQYQRDPSSVPRRVATLLPRL